MSAREKWWPSPVIGHAGFGLRGREVGACVPGRKTTRGGALRLSYGHAWYDIFVFCFIWHIGVLMYELFLVVLEPLKTAAALLLCEW